MRVLTNIILMLTLLSALTGCHHLEGSDPGKEPYDNLTNVNALWRMIDQRYCFLEDKGIDWDSIGEAYRSYADLCQNQQQLFDLCSDMLDNLRDGHVNLSSPWAASYYRAWWSDYPRDFDLRVIEQEYLQFNYRQLGAFTYGFLKDGTGYIRCSTFASGLGEGNIDLMLSYLMIAPGLLIDVRDNGGGELTNVEPLVRRFLRQRITAGYLIHKTGPGHDDFSEPFEYYYYPASAEHLRWGKPVAVLANRSTFSAANNFVQTMKGIPGVKIIGAHTGGGAGLAFTDELPCGWSVRFSACKILDADGVCTEYGIDPSPGFEVHITPQQTAARIDPIIDLGCRYVRGELND